AKNKGRRRGGRPRGRAGIETASPHFRMALRSHRVPLRLRREAADRAVGGRERRILRGIAHRKALGVDELDVGDAEEGEEVAHVRASGLARKAWKRSAVRCGTGSSARSRVMTVASGLASRQSVTNCRARVLDWPPSEKRLDWIWRSVFMGSPCAL